MLTAVICPASMSELKKGIAEGQSVPAEAKTPAISLHTAIQNGLYRCLELRLDYCRDLDPSALPRLPLPAILTLRSKTQGGVYSGNEAARIKTMATLLDTSPAYMDIEDDMDPAVLKEFSASSPGTTIILSHHNFGYTPDLPALLDSMQEKIPPRPGVLYKIACQAHSDMDALTMLAFTRKVHARLRQSGSGCIGISMGKHGITTRILAPVVHYGLCYCPVSNPTAPGQLDIATLVTIYNAHQLNNDTAIYGLLGDPVEQSKGHIFHNAANRQNRVNAVYVKWQISEKEVGEALELLHELGVQGLSITMPLKKAVRPYCAVSGDSPYDVINTLRPATYIATQPTDTKATVKAQAGTCRPGHNNLPYCWEGTNTDGDGALRSIPFSVKGKTVIVMGAGGAATALLCALLEAGARCLVYNRSSKPLPHNLPVYGLEQLFNGPLPEHDVIINTLPFTLELPFETVAFQPQALAFDVSYAGTSRFLSAALKAGCDTLTGDGMFEQQARLQRSFWGLD